MSAFAVGCSWLGALLGAAAWCYIGATSYRSHRQAQLVPSPHQHDWTHWEVTDSSDTTLESIIPRGLHHTLQYRSCPDCGEIETRPL